MSLNLELYSEKEQNKMYTIYDLIKKNNLHNALSLSSETGFYIKDVVECLKTLCIYQFLEEECSDKSTLNQTYSLRNDFISDVGIISMDS